MKKLLFSSLFAFLFIAWLQPLRAQSKDNDVLVLEYGYTFKSYGMYLFWPGKDVEFIPMQGGIVGIDGVLANKKTVYQKINEIVDLGWKLEFIDQAGGNTVYYFIPAKEE